MSQCDDKGSGHPPSAGSESSANLPLSSQKSAIDCPICQGAPVFSVELPCNHTFCYLCIKGVAQKEPEPKCALCRRDIPLAVLHQPIIKDDSAFNRDQPAGKYQWYYGCRTGGWWQYQQNFADDIEAAFQADKAKKFQIQIVGRIYELDFQEMTQRCLDDGKIRKIKRALPDTANEMEGIAGIKFPCDTDTGRRVAVATPLVNPATEPQHDDVAVAGFSLHEVDNADMENEGDDNGDMENGDEDMGSDDGGNPFGNSPFNEYDFRSRYPKGSRFAKSDSE